MGKNRQRSKHKHIRAQLSWPKRLALFVMPRPENDHRPYLARRQGLVALLIVALGFPAAFGQIQTGSVLGIRDQVTAAELVVETNQARSDRGLSELTVNSKLVRAAADKAQDMFANDYWAHVSPEGVEPWHWFAAEGYEYRAAGENLAKNFGTSDGVMTAWLASPEHRANIMNHKYSEIGIAVRDGEINGQDTQLVVALYGTPLDGDSDVGAASTDEPSGVSTDNLSAAAVLASTDENLSFGQRILVSFKTMSPGAIFAIVALLVGAGVALIAHAYRKKLPISRQRTWYKNHGIYKLIIITTIIVAIVAFYSGGQI